MTGSDRDRGAPPRRTRWTRPTSIGGEGGPPLEPWYHVARLVAIPPAKLWFTWRFEDLQHIPPTGPAIVASNHISYLDPIGNAYAVMKAGRRPRFLAKNELFAIPVVGTALRGANQIPVDRSSGDLTSIRSAEAALANGEVVVIYPEATVTKSPDSMPMQGKTGAVRLSLASGVPITPMASWGSQAVWQKSGKGSLKFGRPVWAKAGPALDFSDRASQCNDRDALHEMTDQLMSAITAIVEDLRNRYPKRWTDER